MKTRGEWILWKGVFWGWEEGNSFSIPTFSILQIYFGKELGTSLYGGGLVLSQAVTLFLDGVAWNLWEA